MMKPYEHTRQFQVKYCEADFKDELKTSIALSYMEEVACSSADELGFGYAFVKPRGYAFMVTSVCMEWLSPVRLGDTVTVKTWPTPPSHVIFGREYQLFSSCGELQMQATSRWCLLDRKNGRLLQSKILENQDYSTYNTAKTLTDVQWKIPLFSCEEGKLCYSLTVANSEYDHNMHVNNTRYADYCLNVFTVAELQNRRMRRFQISYLKQCHEGDLLHFYRKAQTQNEYYVQGCNAAGEVVVQAKILFENIGEDRA
jgi:acyl-CoA thioesterase FadM